MPNREDSDEQEIIEVTLTLTRWREVDAFAQQRGITREDAIMALVNSGLSHRD